jgi:putative SOS response-associated peptidase YedK
MAGIYAREPTEFDTAEKNPVNFAILTTKANEEVSHIPTGMFLFPRVPAELLTTYPVTPKMNRASFNSAEAITPLEPTIL